MIFLRGALFAFFMVPSVWANDPVVASAAAPPAPPPEIKLAEIPSLSIPLPPERVLPQFERVQGGSFSQTIEGTTATYHTGAGRNAVDFKTFDIEKGYGVNVRQGSADTKSLFRVTGQDPSIIRGQLSIDQGHVFLSNHNGVYFTKDAILDISKLTAIGGRVNPNEFMAGGDFKITTSDLGTVFNASTTQVKDKGLFSLVGHSVTNTGHILGREIEVNGIAGKEVYVSFSGHDHVGFQVSQEKKIPVPIAQDMVNLETSPMVMTVDQAESTITHVVSMGGTVEATASEAKGSQIILRGDKISVPEGSSLKAESDSATKA